MKRFHRVRVLGFFVLAVLAISMACNQEDAISPTEVPGRPTAADPSIDSPSPTAAALEPGPTAVPALATTLPVGKEPQQPDRSLKVMTTRSSSAPSSLILRRAGGFSLSPMGQNLGNLAGLTVSAIGTVTVAADEAYVVVVPEQRYGPSGPEQMSGDDRKDIIEKLASLGVQESAVEFEGTGRYGPFSISVEIGLGELVEKGDEIVEAVEEIVRHSESHGVRYTLSPENCDSARSLARREAIPSTQKAAEDLAEALSLDLGSVAGALEYPLTATGFGPFRSGVNSCGGQATDPFGALVPFDSEQKVEVSVGLQVTYSIH